MDEKLIEWPRISNIQYMHPTSIAENTFIQSCKVYTKNVKISLLLKETFVNENAQSFLMKIFLFDKTFLFLNFEYD